MNAQISAVLKARDTKFGIEVFVYPTQLQFILNASCHSYCLCMKLYYWLTYSFHFRLWFEYQNITIPRDFKMFHKLTVSISCLYYKQFKDCQYFKILFLLLNEPKNTFKTIVNPDIDIDIQSICIRNRFKLLEVYDIFHGFHPIFLPHHFICLSYTYCASYLIILNCGKHLWNWVNQQELFETFLCVHLMLRWRRQTPEWQPQALCRNATNVGQMFLLFL